MLVLAMEFSRDRTARRRRTGSHGGRRNGVASKVRGAAPPDNGTEVGPTPPPTTERPEPAISGVREGLRRVIDSDVPPDHHPVGWRGGGTP
jgi:hypothetical protein